jgi:hypothetical protein
MLAWNGLARADHHERQQHEQSKPIERSATADSAAAIRDHPHISRSLVDVRLSLLAGKCRANRID